MKTDAFALRHIGPRETDLQHMLKTVGVDSLEQLVYETLPDDIRLKAPLDLEPEMTEYEYLNHIQQLGNKNKVFKSYIGLGYHAAVGSYSTKYFRKPGMVHSLHILSGRNCSRSSGSFIKLSNYRY